MGYFTNTRFTSVADMQSAINQVVELHVQSMRQVSADELGLDPRSGSAWVDEDHIVAPVRNGFDYYAGFEYVDRDDVQVIGDYKFYNANSSRIADALECLMESDGVCSSESDGQPDELTEWMDFDPDC